MCKKFISIWTLKAMLGFMILAMLFACSNKQAEVPANTTTDTVVVDTTNATTVEVAEPQLDEVLILNSVKTIKSIDIVADMSFKILGDLYTEGVITEEQKVTLIKVGDVVRTNQNLARAALTSYMYADKMSADSTKDKLINTLVLSAKSFYKMKDEVAKTYSGITGKDINIPDIFMFDTISNLLIQE